MLLQKLNEYADRLELPPRLYTNAPVRYIIELDRDGTFVEMVDTAGTDKATKRGVPHLVPQIVRANKITPFLLADKADYVPGFVGEAGKPKRVADCHEAFLDLLDRCIAADGDPRAAAVAKFLRADPIGQLGLNDTFAPSATITFRVDDEFVVDLPAVRRFWADQNDAGARDAAIMQCLICGREKPVLERLELKVKGVPDGQMAGTSLISFSAPAFESYGLKASNHHHRTNHRARAAALHIGDAREGRRHQCARRRRDGALLCDGPFRVRWPRRRPRMDRYQHRRGEGTSREVVPPSEDRAPIRRGRAVQHTAARVCDSPHRRPQERPIAKR
jgi:hypothetical protein